MREGVAIEEVGLDAFDVVLRSDSRPPASEKRATATTRFPGAARFASRTSVGPILPPARAR